VLEIKDDTDLACARIKVQRGEKRVVGGLASWSLWTVVVQGMEWILKATGKREGAWEQRVP
jgi:hypothetical protein